ncbi:MAG: 4Fe-4S binding protein [Lachnospiraceae bacterium]
MRKSKVSVAYFSPTGGTKKAADLVASEFTTRPFTIDLGKRENRRKEIYFEKEDLLIAAAPVYGGQLPVVDGLFTNLRGEDTPCIILVGYGNRDYGDTLVQMQHRLSERGFLCIGGLACIIPHTFSEKLGANRPDEEDLCAIHKFTHMMKDKLEHKNFSTLEITGSGQQEPKTMKHVPKLFHQELCNNCQICVRECPVEAISANTLDYAADICINCMKCVKVCVQGAKTYEATEITQYLEEYFGERREVEMFH